MFDEFETSNEMVYHSDQCDMEMILAIALLHEGDIVGARQHVTKALNMFADFLPEEAVDVDIDEMAHSLIVEMIAGGVTTVDSIISDMECQFS